MRPRARTGLALVVAAVWALGAAGAAGAEGPASTPPPVLESVDLALPAEVAAPLRASLAGRALRVSWGAGRRLELWLRRELPAAPGTGESLGVAYGGIPGGALVGALRVVGGWRDYRDAGVVPGTYTLRYALQPTDGNHQGASEYRDFLLLLPAAADGRPEPLVPPDALVARSRGTGREHPRVLALFPPPAGAKAPALARNELGQWTLVAASGGATLGLVVEGHGALEGY